MTLLLVHDAVRVVDPRTKRGDADLRLPLPPGLGRIEMVAHLHRDNVAGILRDRRIAADLRFGHDSGLWPLVGLIGLDGPGDRVPLADSWQKCPAWKWMPMASNIQMVFYRNDMGEVLVKILYNEREMRIKGHEPVVDSFYRWQIVRERLVQP